MKEANDNLTDEELIRGYLDGNMESFNELYARYKRPLYAYLNKLLSDHALADDVFQQTWLKAISRFSAYENRNKFFAWLTMIAHNLAIDAFRKAGTNGEIELEDDAAAQLPGPAGSEPWCNMHNRELAHAIETAVNELTPELKEVFLLRQNEVSFKEIAEIQKCSINTALGRMNYAIKQLRKKLQSWV